MVFKDKEEETEQFSQSVPVKLVTSGRNREVAEMAPPLNLSRGLAECALCLEDFQDTGDRVPRNLACGHTFCTGWFATYLICAPFSLEFAAYAS